MEGVEDIASDGNIVREHGEGGKERERRIYNYRERGGGGRVEDPGIE